jgi:hypothetical protein
MAKLKARGREEIFRVTITRPARDTSTGVAEVQDFRARSGLNLEQLIKIYLDKGWEVVSVNPAYFRQNGTIIEARSQDPFISVEIDRRLPSVAIKMCDESEFYFQEHHADEVLEVAKTTMKDTGLEGLISIEDFLLATN